MSRRALRRLPLVPIAMLLLVLIIPAFFAQWIAPHDPYISNLRARLQPPVGFGGNWDYPLGTDRLGRCMLSRILHGAKYALGISMVGIAIGAILGTALGLISGYLRGWLDVVIMRLVDITFALPSILLALALASISGPSLGLVVLVVVFVIWGFSRGRSAQKPCHCANGILWPVRGWQAHRVAASCCAISCPIS